MKLIIQELQDEKMRENFKRIEREFNVLQSILNPSWKFFELTFTAAVTNYKYPHKLGFVPKDVIETSVIGAGSVTWNYSLFDSTNLNITTTGACTVRAFVGLYVERSGL